MNEQEKVLCSVCHLHPHDGWPGEKGGELCQDCWEAECSDSWWEMHNRMAYAQQVQLVALWKRIAYGFMIMAVSFLVAGIWMAAEYTR